jgi:hypothetical protein
VCARAIGLDGKGYGLGMGGGGDACDAGPSSRKRFNAMSMPISSSSANEQDDAR